MFGFDSKYFFSGFLYIVFLAVKWKNTKKHFFCFLNGYDQSRYQKTKKLSFFWFSTFVGLVFCIESLKNKKHWVFFFDILIDHIHSKNKNQSFFSFFHFKTKKQKTRDNKKHLWVKSKHSLFSSHMRFHSGSIQPEYQNASSKCGEIIIDTLN